MTEVKAPAGSLPGREDREPALLRVATYNIHGCQGDDGMVDIHRTASVINQMRCRIVALQEVRFPENKDVDLLHLLEKDTGLEAVIGVTVHSPTSRFGNALLTDLPIMRVARYDLSVPGREKRGALDISVSLGGRTVRVVATHLGLKPFERRYQVRRVLDILRNSEASAEVTIMMGDINEWFLWGRPLRWIHAYFGRSGAIATYPTRWPLFALDRIWCHPPERIVAVAAFRSRFSCLASDHLPLMAEIAV